MMQCDSHDKQEYKKYDNSNSRIMQFILESRVEDPEILDVGCWMGALGEQLKAHCVCQVDGIDINREVMDIAKIKGYRHLYPIDLNNPEFADIHQKYDFIVFGDVLEHTIDPDSVINKLKLKLKPDGLFVVSLPNVGFLLYRLLHLLGYWDYHEYGVMDKTHLRFFTMDSMKKLFKAHNLRILRKGAFIGLNRSALVKNVAKGLAEICPALFAIQMVFLLSPGERK